MTPLRLLPRLMRVAAILLKYDLDDLVDGAHLFRPLKLVRPWFPSAPADVRALPRGARLRLALTDLGPIFVKAGQVLSTRRDLVPADIADELALLQDQVPPFPGAEARAIVERELKASVTTLYASFDETALASASIAQVHAATLHDGRAVVVKVLRPGIDKRIARDVDLLHTLGELAQRWHPNADKIRPLEVVAEVEKMLSNELDLQREGASASLLRRNFASGVDLYVPEVHWDFSTQGVLTLERVYGVSADDIAAIDAAGLDRKHLAEKGVRLFYEQVFRDNFFHADAHPGNIWVDLSRVDEPRFIALDFGIMGSLPEADQYWLAENFIALFERDYARIAQLHVAAGWMPSTVRLDELEAAVRTVCEPYFTRPLAQISIAELVVKLFQTARKYELTLQPQLILLQKTLLNIEGVGRMLDPEIDIWAVAHPVLRRILRERYSVRATLRDVRRRLPQWIQTAPRVPELVRDALRQVASGQQQQVADPLALAVARDDARRMRRLVACSLLGSSLLVCAALVGTLAARGMWPAIAAGIAGVIAFVAGWPRRVA
ncbi:ubiquinone biosynthesis regulatory protein kinase UbiB [Luteibacter rhizovicinus DSM 16549]|uniref:Ubiquinone biosynthesis regulatory protein kinase UbiB n=1 Tax=Luteibacter rhizovicinus DSM 16549 TaxID=1440763 RepID=A0A0G9HEU3_9GAMM|nr:ubiquinone biosynthesis regulatory protein kinase UbiB [Luteibacter rhizovicinus]APG03452.1 ubiquinone biosynthesis regulatory protein kinase UbiB [Luteibacter rhizovicinus DSM 16549]KLD68066.1 ubiquinone biosynthesis protein UbiB [Luteibacter rhizovicinus DSM 16549]KLD77231.1 ubiquinone biosynthesis protein UbiB [Xanthomonas hyacinthi DSM 19077]